MDQTVWNTLNGRIFVFTNPDTNENTSRLAFHADFLLIFLAPLYILWNDPRALLVVQSIVIASGAFFVYLLSKRVTNSLDISLSLAGAYLLNPFLQRQNIFDFHPVSLATTFLLATFYFFYTKKWLWAAVFVLLSVISKENIYLITFLLGLYLIVSKRNLKFGVILSTLSALVFVLVMKVFIPKVSGGSHFALKFLSESGESLESVLLNMIKDPLSALNIMLEHNAAFYIFRLLLPLGFLSLLGAPFLVFASPDILKNLLTNNSNFRDIYYQYMAEIIPFVFISAIFGINLLKNKLKALPERLIAFYVLVFALLGLWLYSPLPGGKRANLTNFRQQEKSKAQIEKILVSIDSSKSVSATNNLGAHVAHRQNLFNFPHATDSADIVLFLLKKDSGSYQSELSGMEAVMANPQYKLKVRIDGFYFFEKKSI